MKSINCFLTSFFAHVILLLMGLFYFITQLKEPEAHSYLPVYIDHHDISFLPASIDHRHVSSLPDDIDHRRASSLPDGIDHHHVSSLPANNIDQSVLTSTLNNNIQLKNKKSTDRKTIQIKTTKAAHTSKTKQDNQSLTSVFSKSQLREQKQNKIDKNSHQTLLSILHDKIASKQIYPESAILLNQTGTVSIRFVLGPNGTITHIALQTSSGVESIDLAALNAVKRVSPIKEAAMYLQNPTSFLIDVIYI
jgi:TonB family protein